MYSGGEPVFTEADVFTIVIPLSEAATATVGPGGQVSGQEYAPMLIPLKKYRLNQLLDFCIEPRSAAEMRAFIGISSRDYFRTKVLAPGINNGLLKMTIPDKPTSRNQKYVKIRP